MGTNEVSEVYNFFFFTVLRLASILGFSTFFSKSLTELRGLPLLYPEVF